MTWALLAMLCTSPSMDVPKIEWINNFVILNPTYHGLEDPTCYLSRWNYSTKAECEAAWSEGSWYPNISQYAGSSIMDAADEGKVVITTVGAECHFFEECLLHAPCGDSWEVIP